MPDGRCQMMLCRVCLGVTGLRSDLESNWSIPKVNPATGKRFDSVSNSSNEDSRSEFVSLSFLYFLNEHI